MYDVGATNSNGDLFIYTVKAESKDEAIKQVNRILQMKLSPAMKEGLTFVAVESGIKENEE